MSIRLRLTLLYSTILALTLVVFSAGLYVVQARNTLAIMERDLQANAGQLVLAWARFHSDWRRVAPRPAPDATYGDQAQQVLQPLVKNEIARDVVHILDVEGNPLALEMNEASDPLPISNEGLTELQTGQSWMEISEGEESRWLIYNLPVIAEVDTLFSSESSVVGIVQLARPLADRDRSLHAMGITLIVGSLSTTVIAFGVGWLLAGTTLRPIQRITETALAIGESQDFASRVAHKGPNDELGRLATTFNGMLARLQDAYQQLAHALEVQRDFVADVSHELRTPLTTIRGNLALLRREPPLPRDEQGEILDDLMGESERLTRLVTDLLTLARADAGINCRWPRCSSTLLWMTTSAGRHACWRLDVRCSVRSARICRVSPGRWMSPKWMPPPRRMPPQRRSLRRPLCPRQRRRAQAAAPDPGGQRGKTRRGDDSHHGVPGRPSSWCSASRIAGRGCPKICGNGPSTGSTVGMPRGPRRALGWAYRSRGR